MNPTAGKDVPDNNTGAVPGIGRVLNRISRCAQRMLGLAILVGRVLSLPDD